MPDPNPLVDADQLLSLTSDLRAVQHRLDRADVGREQRLRWQRALGAIARGAVADLERAQAQVRRLAALVERTLSPG